MMAGAVRPVPLVFWGDSLAFAFASPGSEARSSAKLSLFDRAGVSSTPSSEVSSIVVGLRACSLCGADVTREPRPDMEALVGNLAFSGDADADFDVARFDGLFGSVRRP